MTTSIGCPVCAGPVSLDRERPRCLIGHDFEPDELQLATQRQADRAMWMAIRALEDASRASLWLLERPELADGRPYLREHVTNAQEAADILREMIAGREGSDIETEHRPADW